MAKKLTLQFTQTDGISLEYYPERLSVSDVVLSETIPTLKGSTTFIAPKETVRTEYELVARIHTTPAFDTISTEKESLLSAGLGVGAQLIISNSPSEFSKVLSTIVLARGAYDIAQRLLVPFTATSADLLTSSDAIQTLEKLRKYTREGKSCTINWDLDNLSDGNDDDKRYIIKRLEAKAITMQQDTGVTTTYEIDLALVHEGNRVEVNGGN